MATRKPAAKKPAKKASPSKKPVKKAVKKAPAKKTAKKAPKKASNPAKKASKPPKTAKKAVKSAPVKKTAKKAPVKKVAKKSVKKVVQTSKKAQKAQKNVKKAVKSAPAKKTAKKSAKKASSQPPLVKGRRPLPPPAQFDPPGFPSLKNHKAKPPKPFKKAELAHFRELLLAQLELIQGNVDALAGDNLKRSQDELAGDSSAPSNHMADQGTDNFDRELALNLASSRQESLYDIEDAIQRMEDGTYGICEACGNGIERARLRALPFAKKCMVCQNAAERGRTRYRPLGGTLNTRQMNMQDGSDAQDM